MDIIIAMSFAARFLMNYRYALSAGRYYADISIYMMIYDRYFRFYV